MPKATVEAHQVTHNGRERWRVGIPKAMRAAHEGRTRRFFADEKEAVKFAKQINASRHGLVGQFISLRPETQSRLLLCLDRVGGDVSILESAAQLAIARKAKTEKSLVGAIMEWATVKEKSGKRSLYTGHARFTLEQFSNGRETKKVSEVTTEEIAKWLHGNGWGAETRRGYLTRLRSFFRWCVKQGFAAADPTASIEMPSREDRPPGILTVPECSRLLAACRTVDAKLLPYVSLGLFAGIRPFEMRRLSRSNISGAWIEVPGKVAKTRSRRLVEIWSPLDQWLKLGGEIPPGANLQKRFDKVRAGITPKLVWTHDCMRHSFVSYALPIHGAAKTALMAGHSESMLFRHYRELVTLEQANAFWAMTPDRVLNVAPA